MWVRYVSSSAIGPSSCFTSAGVYSSPWRRIVSSGAYFAWVEPPFDIPSDTLARRLVSECGVLMLPGTMFMPEGGGRGALRIAFANADRRGLADLATRLSRFAP